MSVLPSAGIWSSKYWLPFVQVCREIYISCIMLTCGCVKHSWIYSTHVCTAANNFDQSSTCRISYYYTRDVTQLFKQLWHYELPSTMNQTIQCQILEYDFQLILQTQPEIHHLIVFPMRKVIEILYYLWLFFACCLISPCLTLCISMRLSD